MAAAVLSHLGRAARRRGVQPPTTGNNHRPVGVVAMGTGTPTTRSPIAVARPSSAGDPAHPPTPQLDKLSACDVSSAGYRLQATGLPYVTCASLSLQLADHTAGELGGSFRGSAVFAGFESGYANTVTPRGHNP
jgi:hypothetical protein